jgi:hypothetical protein
MIKNRNLESTTAMNVVVLSEDLTDLKAQVCSASSMWAGTWSTASQLTSHPESLDIVL